MGYCQIAFEYQKYQGLFAVKVGVIRFYCASLSKLITSQAHVYLDFLYLQCQWLAGKA